MPQQIIFEKLTMCVCFYSAALTVKQLKELCRKHGLKVTGTKATLSLQLENADRMAQEPREGDSRSGFDYCM